jgi:nucleolar MIF4G domain-containing protein 1
MRHAESLNELPDSEPSSYPGKPPRTPRLPVDEQKVQPKSILKTTKQSDRSTTSNEAHSIVEKAPRRVIKNTTEEDDVIAFLEKKLGRKGKNGVPKVSNADDEFGLDDLLDGFEDDIDDQGVSKRNAKAEEEEWLAQKRRNARSHEVVREASDSENSDGQSDSAIEGLQSSDEEFEEDFSEDDEFGGFESESDANPDDLPLTLPPKRVRENPYVAPPTSGDEPAAKYIPPSLRKNSSSNSEDLTRLRRQIQGLVNRLTEANLIFLLGDIEKLYRDNARQNVTSILIDLLLVSICEPTSLPDTLIILPAGFITAIYKIIGTDFGAQVIQKVVELFDEHYAHATKLGNSGPDAATSDSSKETSNLITLLAQLYNFRLVSSNLMFDYIRLFLSSLSELNAELLLKMIRASGPRLRQDDPSSLKDIVNMLRPAVASVGEENMSVRTKFMIESINDLKNNKVKTGAAASAITSEHGTRMKKTLGSLNTRSIKASEPLRIGLRDIREVDKKGKWWLVGASWAGKEKDVTVPEESAAVKKYDRRSENITGDDSGPSDLAELAREQRMNTDIRRAIFITIMSASDYQDASLRLKKLKLKKAQELEIPKVLIHCVSAEEAYNPYYTLIAKKLCSDRKLKMAFQFCLWDLFKKLGEGEDSLSTVDEEETLDARQLVNLAKMFGSLIVEGDLSLTVLKNLNLSYLQPRTKEFIEVFMITVFLQSQRSAIDARDEKAVARLIVKAKELPQLTVGLQHFLRKVVSKTDLAGGKLEKATVKWACRVAGDVLDSTAEIHISPFIDE